MRPVAARTARDQRQPESRSVRERDADVQPAKGPDRAGPGAAPIGPIEVQHRGLLWRECRSRSTARIAERERPLTRHERPALLIRDLHARTSTEDA